MNKETLNTMSMYIKAFYIQLIAYNHEMNLCFFTVECTQKGFWHWGICLPSICGLVVSKIKILLRLPNNSLNYLADQLLQIGIHTITMKDDKSLSVL